MCIRDRNIAHAQLLSLGCLAIDEAPWNVRECAESKAFEVGTSNYHHFLPFHTRFVVAPFAITSERDQLTKGYGLPLTRHTQAPSGWRRSQRLTSRLPF